MQIQFFLIPYLSVYLPTIMFPIPKPIIVHTYGYTDVDLDIRNSLCILGIIITTDYMPINPSVHIINTMNNLTHANLLSIFMSISFIRFVNCNSIFYIIQLG